MFAVKRKISFFQYKLAELFTNMRNNSMSDTVCTLVTSYYSGHLRWIIARPVVDKISMSVECHRFDAIISFTPLSRLSNCVTHRKHETNRIRHRWFLRPTHCTIIRSAVAQ